MSKMDLYRALFYHVHLAYLSHRTTKQVHDEAVDCIITMWLKNRRWVC